MVTKYFTSEGSTQNAKYNLPSTCAKPSFDVSYDSESPEGWLSTAITSTENAVGVSVLTNESDKERIGYITAVINGSHCTGDKRLKVVQAANNPTDTGIDALNITKTQLDCSGENQIIGQYTTSSPSFSVSRMSATSSIPGLSISFTEPTNGQGDVVASWGYTAQPVYGTIEVTYAGRRAGTSNVSQVPCENAQLSYSITATSLNGCGSNFQEKIGEYYYNGCNSVNNSALSVVGRNTQEFPTWIETVKFGTPVPSNANSGKGDIMITYTRNNTEGSRTWSNIGFTYDGYINLTAEDGSSTSLTQPKGTGCDEPSSDKPTTCSEVDFHHWHHPYANSFDYYYLEHTDGLALAASQTEYILGTASSYDILDEMWKDVRVEIYDITPLIEHRSSHGTHNVNTTVPGVQNPTFDQIKAAHEATCAYAGSGEYKVVGYSNSNLSDALIAVYQDGNLVEAETKHDIYDGFWFKAESGVNELVWTYHHDQQYRGIKFNVQQNIGSDKIERYVMVKIYPKIGDAYCMDTCTDCERTGLCTRNSCITDIIQQKFENCDADEEYVSKNAYFQTNLLLGYDDTEGIHYDDGGGVSNYSQGAAMYGYMFGVCDNYESGVVNGQYMDSIMIVKLTEETTYKSSGDIDPSTQETYGNESKILGVLATVSLGVNDYSGYSDSDVEHYVTVNDDFVIGINIAPTSSSDNTGWIRVRTDKWNVTPSTTQENQRYRYRGIVVYNRDKYTLPTPSVGQKWSDYVSSLNEAYCRASRIMQSNVYEHYNGH